ncbi:MAG: DUF4199 domain-containing protein [Flavisolibacter sp.]|nr:DUF4199 domain-containing protein [Flavisolibacter sp.]
MRKTALRFGLYGIYTILAFFLLSWLIFNQRTENYEAQEIAGWAGILLSVIFVYFGLKYYRDKQNNGSLNFGEGLKLGMLIVLFPSVAFAIFDVVYVMVLDPQFFDKYYTYQVEQIRNTVPASELAQRMKELQQQRDMFSSPLVQFIVMFLSVFVTGLIVTIISTLLLKRKVMQPVLAK